MIRARFFVAGTVAPQGSKSLATKDRRGRRLANPRMYDASKKLGPWRAAVAAEAFVARQKLGKQLTGPLVIEATFYLLRPKKPTRSYPGVDADKATRALLDGIATDGTLVANDSQFTTLQIRKRWTGATIGHTAGCDVVISDDEELT